ncbi:MAG: hypothetical protein ACI8RD_009482 [Bacillariaceae sp.]|jgi:hypothetical protein
MERERDGFIISHGNSYDARTKCDEHTELVEEGVLGSLPVMPIFFFL